MAEKMKIDGGCHCGAVTYEAAIDPQRVAVCHCTDCQTLTSSAFRIVGMVEPGDFTLKSGTPTNYVKTAESGARRAQAFCGTCGTPLWSTAAEGPPDYYSLRVASARQRDRLPPRLQAWYRSAQPWVEELAKLPRRETQ